MRKIIVIKLDKAPRLIERRLKKAIGLDYGTYCKILTIPEKAKKKFRTLNKVYEDCLKGLKI